MIMEKTELLTKCVQRVINIFLLVRFCFLFENENNNQFIFITYTLMFFSFVNYAEIDKKKINIVLLLFRSVNVAGIYVSLFLFIYWKNQRPHKGSH